MFYGVPFGTILAKLYILLPLISLCDSDVLTVWFFSASVLVNLCDLSEHISYVVNVLTPPLCFVITIIFFLVVFDTVI